MLQFRKFLVLDKQLLTLAVKIAEGRSDDEPNGIIDSMTLQNVVFDPVVEFNVHLFDSHKVSLHLVPS